LEEKRSSFSNRFEQGTGLKCGSLGKSLSIMEAACNRYSSSRVHLDREKGIGIDEIHAIELRRYCSL